MAAHSNRERNMRVGLLNRSSQSLYSVRRAWTVLFAGAAALCLIQRAAYAEKITYTAASFQNAPIDVLDAIGRLQGLVEYKKRGSHGCPGLIASGSRLVGDCRRDDSDALSAVVRFDFRYSDYPQVEIKSCCGGAYQFLVNHARGGSQILLYMFKTDHRAGWSSHWAQAWITLAQPRPVPPVSEDREFLAATVVASSLDGEALRRVQVQAEVALRENRNIDAARLYRGALRTAPAWADGHYNLALLYGQLELHPEAITEMRRYLHLVPNAPDMRRAQDQIYEWEASLPPAPRRGSP